MLICCRDCTHRTAIHATEGRNGRGRGRGEVWIVISTCHSTQAMEGDRDKVTDQPNGVIILRQHNSSPHKGLELSVSEFIHHPGNKAVIIL
ncbi:hypothetical protein MUK42_37692 [Musa troglodytarum]|uniref:Uncharacterized protein n=1 Tax=Musa troglodytarum TaxID=320322 RepID=A0A9E7JAE8_9LILI|nr:hypothetical protein MUK42_37692 [Musa troglodytarum]